MPAPSDLTGQHFGQLIVVSDAGFQRHGKKNVHYWWCECTCGRQTCERQDFLRNGRVTACPVCRRGPCIICGGEITEGGPQTNTCSQQCHIEKRRRTDLRCYAKAVAEDPEYNTRRWQERKAKMQQDGTWEDYLAKDRAYKRKRRNNPSTREAMQQRAAAHYHRNRDKILQQRRTRWNALTPEERREKIQRAREQGRQWRQQWRAEIKADPQRYKDYLDYQREAGRKHYARQTLREMLDIGQKLGEKHNESNNDPE